MRHKPRTDGNHGQIVAALRKLGFSVESLASNGKGVPDILAGRKGVNYLIEVKNGSLSPSQRRLTPDQEVWHGAWRGQVVTISSVEQLAEWVNDL